MIHHRAGAGQAVLNLRRFRPGCGGIIKSVAQRRSARWANGQVDFAVTLADRQRLRGSAFKHMHGVSIALRLLPLTCPQLSALGVPRAIPELLSNDNGLILVTGATGREIDHRPRWSISSITRRTGIF